MFVGGFGMVRRAKLREAARARAAQMVERLVELVSCESPSGAVSELERCADILAGWGDAALGRLVDREVRTGLPHLLWRAPNPAILVLGHFDTVWPLGTISHWPLVIQDSVARGPGVFDMKAGIVQIMTALELVTDPSRVSVLLTCDEETGSVTSRDLIVEQARRARAVLVGEPSADGGAVKVARKGVASYELSISGKAAHAGLEPELGVNAAVEVAYRILKLPALEAKDLGTTVTPTLLAAGTTANTVPETATLRVDVRGWTRGELKRVDLAIRDLAPGLDGTTTVVGGGVNRYPLESEMALPLLEYAQRAALDLGIEAPAGVRSGGGSDGNLTAAAGIPTLDGLGAVGGHPHGRKEWVDVAAMPDRAALLAALIDDLCETAGPT
jgi:glutamate carboxypeptidase